MSKKTTSTLTPNSTGSVLDALSKLTGPTSPLGAITVLYAAGPIPGTYAYAGPPVEPWTPTEPSPSVPNVTITTTTDPGVTRLEKAVADFGCKLDRLTAAVEMLIAGLKVREVAEEMLRKVSQRKRR